MGQARSTVRRQTALEITRGHPSNSAAGRRRSEMRKDPAPIYEGTISFRLFHEHRLQPHNRNAGISSRDWKYTTNLGMYNYLAPRNGPIAASVFWARNEIDFRYRWRLRSAKEKATDEQPPMGMPL
jgi:hypothetical protein